MKLLVINSWEELLTGAVIGIIVVFIVLTILVLLFEFIQKMVISMTKKKVIKEGKKVEEIKDIPADDIAAISLALHLYFTSLYDEENHVLTIKRIERRYSPWNSKIYGLTNLHR